MKIELNNNFYSKEAIEESLKDFKEVCEGKILNENIDVELDTEDEKIKEEFCNYVLGLMKNNAFI